MLKKKHAYTVAVLGATGAVGKESLEILEERNFPIETLRLFSSKRSAGEVLTCQGKEYKVEELTEASSFAGVDIAFISATDAISRDYGARLGAAGIVVIDEAYHAFADASFMHRLSEFPNLLVMRTLSKLGLAGLRLGLLIGRSEWLHEFEKVRLPYNVGIMTQIIADEVLQQADVLLEQAQTIKTERAKMLAYLETIDGMTVFPSDANFILFRINAASQIFQALKQRRILIKKLDGTHPLLENCLRVTVGTPEENVQFCTTLNTIVTESAS